MALKLLGIHLQTVLVQMPSGTEGKIEASTLSVNNLNLAFEGFCTSPYSTADTNLSPFYFNNKHQVPSMDSSAGLLVLPQGYLLLLTSFVWISCWFNRHCEDDMLINDPGYLFGIGLFLICPLSLISNTCAHVHRHTYIQSPTGTGGSDLFS